MSVDNFPLIYLVIDAVNAVKGRPMIINPNK